ncbi:hypothetical protein [Streptomyces zaomyceticus]|uniref:hypothetical protein n=1 Tax=Streptomyces zaomyceticus TaxID=68286 RepID=UPI002E22C0B5
MATAISTPTTAGALADLLPARRGAAWEVGPVPQCIRAGAVSARLSQGDRALDVVEHDGRVEVYADRPDAFHGVPDAVVTETGPDAAAALAALVLRIVLPRLEREAAAVTKAAHGDDQVVIDAAQSMNEVGFALIDHGAHPTVVPRPGGAGLLWTLTSGAEWGLWALPSNGNLALSYEGPQEGLYAVLPLLLPAPAGYERTDLGTVFTRHLTDRHPQLRPLNDHEVEFGRRDEPGGWITVPQREPADYADDSRRVFADFSFLGADLLLAAVPYLV